MQVSIPDTELYSVIKDKVIKMFPMLSDIKFDADSTENEITYRVKDGDLYKDISYPSYDQGVFIGHYGGTSTKVSQAPYFVEDAISTLKMLQILQNK